MTHVQLLHQTSNRGHGDCHSDGSNWNRRDAEPSHSPIPKHCSSGNSGKGHLPRSRCSNSGAVRSHAHRATNERRGQHELHVLEQRE